MCKEVDVNGSEEPTLIALIPLLNIDMKPKPLKIKQDSSPFYKYLIYIEPPNSVLLSYELQDIR